MQNGLEENPRNNSGGLFLKIFSSQYEKNHTALAGVTQLVGHHPAN